MTSNIEKKIDLLTKAIEKLVDFPIAPILPLGNSLAGDHELLQRLDVKVDALKEDIRNLIDATNIKTSDHESRIKILENTTTKLVAYGTALVFMVGIAQFIISRIWK